jgi:hypothetical protein
MRTVNGRKIAFATGAIMSVAMSGCAYRLQAPFPASQHSLVVVAKSPERYTLPVYDKSFPVAADGSVTFDYPRVRSGCDVYLFDRIPLSRASDPFKTKAISLTEHGTIVQIFSLRDVSKLSVDSTGSPILRVKGPR